MESATVTAHEKGLGLFRAGRVQESVAFFAEALCEHETSDGWNDWAAAVQLCGDSAEAERGYRRALELDPWKLQAAANLGVLLTQTGRTFEAVSFLTRSLCGIDEAQRPAVENLLRQCHISLAEQAKRKLAERKGHSQPTESLPVPNGQSVTDPVAAPDWLQAALKRQKPKDETPFIYFLHIPKTSGTSFHRFLIDAFGEANMSPLRTWEDVLCHSGPAGNWKVWSGHFGGMLPFILPSWPRIVTILRDPVERVISQINHVQRDPEHRFHYSAKRMTVLELYHHRGFQRALDNCQARYLASLAPAQMVFRSFEHRGCAAAPVDFPGTLFSTDPQYGLLDSAIRAIGEMDMVGIAEAHHETVKLFARKFNVPAPAEAYHFNTAPPSQLKRAELSPEELECIQDLTRIDQVVYDYALQLFERECRRAKISPKLHMGKPIAAPQQRRFED